METIKYTLENYYVIVNLKTREVAIVCEETKMEQELDSKRLYDFPSEQPVKNVEFIDQPEQYIHIYFEDGSDFQIKLQTSSEIVLDYFDRNGCLINDIGAWDFWD